MCGLSGHWPGGAALAPALAQDIGERMAQALRHRGPDGGGSWVGPQGLCLAHRRLAIIDLSEGGAQPMHCHSGRYTIVFNGEIYNYRALRAQIDAACGPLAWRSRSDTEVLLQAISCWGLEAALARLDGMFAFALWDAQTATLHLARDRFGEKPLYYGYAGDAFVFGSELKALFAHPQWSGRLDTDAVVDFLRLSYVPAPLSIFANVRKLMPGCSLAITRADVAARAWPASRPYWSARQVALAAMADPAAGSERELVDGTESRLRAAVRSRLVADVPLGAFLAGGIDSSLVAAMMMAESTGPVRTFSIGVHDLRYDEARHAAEIARHLGTEHTELYVSPGATLDIVAQLPALYDEPFGDSSQIPTFMVAQMSRRHVSVALSGDGGDELFGGYNRHSWVPRIWQWTRHLPPPLRHLCAQVLEARSPGQFDAAFAVLRRVLPSRLHARTVGDKLHKLAGVLGAATPQQMYAGLVSSGAAGAALMLRPASGSADAQLFRPQEQMALAQWMMLCDTENFMPDDVLTKVDRASMGVGLEVRVPFLDAALYEWAWRLPVSMKIRHGQGKWVLREVLRRHLPPALIDRPKSGFGIPLDALLRGPLSDWMDASLARATLDRHGVLDPDAVDTLRARHRSGKSNNAYLLWNVLALTNWIEAQRAHIHL
ncbi:MAG: asparagine synthase (glutamine-hydrolyzing) [Pseudomonadota bacterium]